jgi:flavorubredoxin
MHLATSERFADEIDESLLEYEGSKYYANILLPMSALVTKLIKKVGELNLPIEIIACDHGPIWRQDLDKIIGWYAKWAEQKPTNKAVVVFDTMWFSTAKMAEAIAEGFMDAGALVVGSPTLNNNMYPTVADLLTYLKGLKPKNLVGAAFGSYGWSGEAVGQLRAMLEEMKIDLVDEGLRVKFVPNDDALKQCFDLGVRVAEKTRGLLEAA